MIGAVVVLIAIVAATLFWLWRKRRDGGVRAIPPAAAPPMLTREDIGHDLGARATLVQFSTAFCQPCRAARGTLAHVASTADGVAHVEIDAESHLDLVRRLGILRTPTTLVLDGAGRVAGRATGVPRPDEVRAALPG